ncbi:MAG: DUF4912 domain-containing protein, partial [Candidatus Omnitrophota bacterium]
MVAKVLKKKDNGKRIKDKVVKAAKKAISPKEKVEKIRKKVTKKKVVKKEVVKKNAAKKPLLKKNVVKKEVVKKNVAKKPLTKKNVVKKEVVKKNAAKKPLTKKKVVKKEVVKKKVAKKQLVKKKVLNKNAVKKKVSVKKAATSLKSLGDKKKAVPKKRLKALNAGISVTQTEENKIESLRQQRRNIALPQFYNEDKITAMVIDPWHIHTYWELRDISIDETGIKIIEHGANSFVRILRIYEIDAVLRMSSVKNYYDIKIGNTATNWYM